MAQHAPTIAPRRLSSTSGDIHGTRERFCQPGRLAPQEIRGVHALVKWESPADEVRGIAAGAAVLLRDHAVLPHQIGFAVPNRTWAVQLAQACKVMGVRASIAEAGEVPSGSAAVIFDFRTPERNVEWLFVVGCTEGLMPTAAATGDDEASRAVQQE